MGGCGEREKENARESICPHFSPFTHFLLLLSQNKDKDKEPAKLNVSAPIVRKTTVYAGMDRNTLLEAADEAVSLSLSPISNFFLSDILFGFSLSISLAFFRFHFITSFSPERVCPFVFIMKNILNCISIQKMRRASTLSTHVCYSVDCKYLILFFFIFPFVS